MRARVLALLALIVAVSSISHAQGYRWEANPWTESFRSASTAGILEDDIDILLDPARVCEIGGTRLYTNLSNLVDKDEEVFSNNDNGYFLIGGSGKLTNSGYGYFGALYDRYQDKNIDSTESTTTTYRDIDMNGSYDEQSMVNDQSIVSREEFDNHWYLAYNKELGDKKIGLAYYRNEESYFYRLFNSYQQEDNNYVTGLLYTYNGEGQYNDSSKVSENAILGSFWMPFGPKVDLNLGGLAGFLSTKYGYHYEGTSTEDNSPADTRIDDVNTNEHAQYARPYSGTKFFVWAGGRYKWSDNVKTEGFARMGMISQKTTSDAMGTYEYSQVTRITFGTDLIQDTQNRNIDIGLTGDAAASGFELFARTVAKLDEKVSFGMGLNFSTYGWEDNFTSDSLVANQYSYNDGDNQLLDPDDSVTVENYSTAIDYKTTGSYTTLGIPVGLEFKVANPVVIRLGARYDLGWDDSTRTRAISSYSALHRRTVTGDSVITESISPNPNTLENGTSASAYTKTSQTSFSYGAGWSISEHLKIDLMGFANLTNLSGWKLSATMKF
ncbi:hypothetical protein HY768_00370 [candidate division TA06 bacterium]|uniref:Autotransporter outer membrane beta-barrel domain-containing protein n=1 Tax=candidate division TA06 bacterium TaxID=2250710 RepID=A0A933IBY7_UNCT6|nr:hypothetical protein [candidate division TA06 bacterium]